MAKYACPPQKPSGAGSFSDNLVGLQIVQGGGLTQGNFQFTTSVVEKVNRTFDIGVFSEPISLSDLDITSIDQAQQIYNANFKVYPNFDETNILNFVAYGPLTNRFSAAVTNIVNFYPAALEVDKMRLNLTTGSTAFNITYDSLENLTSLDISVASIKNPFSIDFTTNATQNINNLEFEVSKYRNLTSEFVNYILQVNNNSYELFDITPTTSISAGTLSIIVVGDPFSGQSVSYDSLVIRPNDTIVNEVFNLELDEVEELLLNRYITPRYTAKFQVPTEGDDGTIFIKFQSVTWNLDGQWNIDIRTSAFQDYIETLNLIGEDFDTFRTDLVSRFYTTDAFKEFDTSDNKVAKVLKIYGRSFDETKKYIDAITHMTSINYNVGNDVPSKLLVNIAQTLGWSTNISPIQNSGFITSLYGQTQNEFPGYSDSKTLEELQYQYYRNLIMNSGYLFRSKGTRKSIEFLLNFIGAPEALIEFNENVYLADGPISIEQFDELYITITGGTYAPTLPQLDSNNTYRFNGVTYSAFTSSTSIIDISTTINDFPIDDNGYPSSPQDTDNMFFQKGEGWFESTPQHRSPEIVDNTNSVFTGQNFNVQTSLEPFTYGEKYLDIYRNFPYLGIGFEILKTNDNKKSWSNSDSEFRKSLNAGYNSLYEVSDDKLVINVKNIDLFLNPAQALAYDVWYLSNTKSYPIPSTGLSSPYPQTGGTDWTFINPKPQNKTFYEFYRTFWSNMINVRNRQFSSDGKTSGYPTLQSIFWKYLTMYQDVGIENNNFNYQNMINYIEGIGDYWIRLVEQFIPATTIWNTGTKLENSIFHRQKFIYRPQRGCFTIEEEISGPQVGGGYNNNDCSETQFIVDMEYDLNNIQTQYNLSKLALDCDPSTTTIVSMQYGFDIVITNYDGTSNTLSYIDPVVFLAGSLDITETQWYDFIAQGMSYIFLELAQLGIGYTKNGYNLIFTSENCEVIDSIELELKFINVQLTCI